MSEDEYRREVVRLGLTPTVHRTEFHIIHVTMHGDPFSVPDPSKLSARERAAAIGRLKMYLGIGYPRGGPGVH